jgi:hypothetical protein
MEDNLSLFDNRRVRGCVVDLNLAVVRLQVLTTFNDQVARWQSGTDAPPFCPASYWPPR